MINKLAICLLRLGVVVTSFAIAAPALAAPGDWASAGRDLYNSRYQEGDPKINSKSVGGLRPVWTINTDGDVTANPAVEGQYLYFPDSAGSLYKVNKSSGAIVWKNPIARYTGIAGDFARATPAISGNALILGNQSGKFLGVPLGQPNPEPAQVFAVDKNTGELIWKTQVDETNLSFVTHSAIVANGMAIVGIASNEELVAGFVPKAYWTWHFRGSVVALDVATGAIKWRTYTVPPGYFGGAVWGSTGAVDLKLNQVYMATGNNYMVPDSVLNCINGGGSPPSCMDPDNRFNSIIALDLTTGAIKWTGRGLSYDAWNVGCGLNVPGFTIAPNDNCPNPQGPDWDFSQGPLMFSDTGKGTDRGLVGAGQKSGMFWAFRAKDGKLIWSTQVAPGGLTGGLQWGSSTDGTKIYVAVANSGRTGSGTAPGVWTLKDGSTTTAGGWAALDAASGKVLWTTKDPLGSRAEGAVSGTNDVIFGCNMDPANGTMYAMNAKNGAVLWSYNGNSGSPTYGACTAGPSISDGMLFWGTGTFLAPGPKRVFGFGF